MKDSYLLPGNLEGLGEFVPNLQVERFPHSTHWIVHEMPDAVNASIRKFLDTAS
jgi:epoxide hydrolase 4